MGQYSVRCIILLATVLLQKFVVDLLHPVLVVCSAAGIDLAGDGW